ncbi:MAG TPA: hypothetical protein VNI52_14325 [Sphingobacteriaceae bacterium]|nr:hypothetical protein [Sphingobacteriaceae bacterium]
MPYKKIKAHELVETDLRNIWENEYCLKPVITFDGVSVRFYADMFDHAFFESANRVAKDKSILSYNRLEKIYWIKETLKDASALLKQGWDNQTKSYFEDRRLAIVKGNYVVVIRFTALLKGKFVTAYEKDDITNILNSPDFIKTKEFFGDKA